MKYLGGFGFWLLGLENLVHLSSGFRVGSSSGLAAISR